MYKIKIKHKETDQEYGMQGSKEEAQAYVERMKVKFGEDKLEIVEKNLNLSKTYRNEQKLASRKAEYPSLEEVLHVILDHGIDSPEFAVLQGKRAEIKIKYKLED